MDIPAFLATKRRGGSWSRDELRAWSRAIAEGTAADCQVGAFAMAVSLAGMEDVETMAWTEAVRDSGTVLRWTDLRARGPVLDKHSTGGVGDCVSIVLAPMLAACGAFVPMISGRGLGHTGGTLDKLSALPGYRCEIDEDSLRRVVADTGMAIVGAGPSLAPADRRLYAVRDVTATVDALPLIVASILGKKLAAGADALVLDVKRGCGAMTSDPEQAKRLATTLIDVAQRSGLRCSALITDMDEPLAPAVGNGLEIALCLDYLRGRSRPERLHAVTMALGAELLVLTGMVSGTTEAEARLLRALDSGAAAECFARSVSALGGPPDVFAWRASTQEQAPVQRVLRAQTAGFVRHLHARRLGEIAVDLGAGRRHPDQRIDPWVGLRLAVQRGDRVDAGQPLCEVHARDEAGVERALRAMRQAVSIEGQAPVLAALVERFDTARPTQPRHRSGVAA